MSFTSISLKLNNLKKNKNYYYVADKGNSIHKCMSLRNNL